MFNRFGGINKNQAGFTLIELAVVIAITGLIGVGITTATFQVISQSAQNTDYTAASRHTLNAVYWISRDAQMSQTVEPNGASGFPLTLSWVEWDNSTHQVTYTLEDGKLQRSYSADGGEPEETAVAQHINPGTEMTNCEFAGGVLTLKVTATVGEGSTATSVTKVRQIAPRPGL